MAQSAVSHPPEHTRRTDHWSRLLPARAGRTFYSGAWLVPVVSAVGIVTGLILRGLPLAWDR